jgi:hypothetical protein
MKQIRQTIVAFLAGVLVAASISAIGRGTQVQGARWKIATVDVGSIEHKFYTQDLTTSAAKTLEETNKQTEALLSQGYEPFSATVYNNGVFSNEKVWFFRKRE